MVRDIFIWNYWSLLLWRWERKGCKCDWTNLHSHVGELLRSWTCSSSSNRKTFFQQAGATRLTARDSMAAVRNLFPNHVISRYGDITWPARSPDLSACDFSLMGVAEISSFKSSSTPHSSEVETWNSARSQTNSCWDASKNNGWCSQKTCQVPRAECWSSECCYFQKGLLFSMC